MSTSQGNISQSSRPKRVWVSFCGRGDGCACTDVSAAGLWSAARRWGGSAPPARRPSAAVSDGCACLAQPSLAFESLGRRLLGKEKTEPGLLARDTALLFLCRSLGFSLFQPSVAWIQASPAPAPCEMESVCLAATGSEQPAGCLVPNPKDPPTMGCWHRLVGMCQ